MAVTVTSTTIQVKDKASPKEAVPSPEPNLWDKMVSWMNPNGTAPAAAAAPKEEFGLLVKLGITRQPRFDEDAVSSRIYSISSREPDPKPNSNPCINPSPSPSPSPNPNSSTNPQPTSRTAPKTAPRPRTAQRTARPRRTRRQWPHARR